MSEEKHAEQLARWLDELERGAGISHRGPGISHRGPGISHPSPGRMGALPPDDLDPDVVESVLALRPDLAPPPALSADDILASVTRGPLAAGDAAPAGSGEGAEVVSFPGGPGSAPPPAPEQEASEPGTRRSPWAVANRWGGLAVVVATAATLLLVALPVLEEAAPPAAEAPSAIPSAEGPVAAAPMPAQETTAAEPTEGDGVAVAEPEIEAGRRQRQSKELPAGTADRLAAASSADASTSEGQPEEKAMLQDLGYLEEPELDAVADLGVEAEENNGFQDADDLLLEDEIYPMEEERIATGSVRGGEIIPEAQQANRYDGGYDLSSDLDAVADLDAADAPAAEPAAPKVAKRPSARPKPAPPPVAAPADEGYLAEEAEPEEVVVDEESAGGLFGGLGKRKAEEPAAKKDAAAPAAAEQAPLTKGSETRSPSVPASLRSQGVPSDLGTGWRRGLDGITAARIDKANAIADAALRSGDPAKAAEALLDVVAPPSEAGQVQAARAVALYLQAGQVAPAVAVARQGLALSSDNTAARSALLVAYGDALMASGDRAGAEDAWRQAAALNAAR